MSLLRPERIHAILAPGRLVLFRNAGDCQEIPLQDDGNEEGFLSQVEEAISKYVTSKSRLGLMLAGSHARYALTAPVDTLLSEKEEGALARQAFRERYGDASQDWIVRHQAQELGQAFFACAVEPDLISGIQSIGMNSGIRIDSIEPLLAVLYTQPMRIKPVQDGWLAIAEPGWLHLVLLKGRAWVQMASVRTFGHWADELKTLLMREATLHGQNHDAPLWLVSAIPGLSVPAQFSSWRLLPGRAAKSNMPYVDLALGMQ